MWWCMSSVSVQSELRTWNFCTNPYLVDGMLYLRKGITAFRRNLTIHFFETSEWLGSDIDCIASIVYPTTPYTSHACVAPHTFTAMLKPTHSVTYVSLLIWSIQWYVNTYLLLFEFPVPTFYPAHIDYFPTVSHCLLCCNHWWGPLDWGWNVWLTHTSVHFFHNHLV